MTSSEQLTLELERLSGWKRNTPNGFTAAYLLRLLPASCYVGAGTRGFGTSYLDKVHCFDREPEDAICKLLIEMFKKGLLTKGVEWSVRIDRPQSDKGNKKS